MMIDGLELVPIMGLGFIKTLGGVVSLNCWSHKRHNLF